uniref:DUF4281 domain-containing protein n=1 Tax=Alexandrium monilatum TaxID=311494 RepID=A0A7S4V3J3_9DINO
MRAPHCRRRCSVPHREQSGIGRRLVHLLLLVCAVCVVRESIHAFVGPPAGAGRRCALRARGRGPSQWPPGLAAGLLLQAPSAAAQTAGPPGDAKSPRPRSDPVLVELGTPYELFGFSAAQLFPISNISLVTWLLLLFLPSWEHTKRVALVAPAIDALLYASATVFLASHPAPDAPPIDFGSLEGIATAFKNPDGVYAGWLHYCVFDPLVGLGEVLDSQQQKVPHWLVVPCLLLTLLFGPIGFLSYLTVRTVIISTRGEVSL